jgi:hypothetical protein
MGNPGNIAARVKSKTASTSTYYKKQMTRSSKFVTIIISTGINVVIILVANYVSSFSVIDIPKSGEIS